MPVSDFIRPEARRALIRYQQPLIGCLVVALGIWWATGFGLVRWLGFLLILGGSVFVIEGLRRARLLRGGGFGPGVVEVDERQIAWFAADVGGVVSVDALSWVSIHSYADKPANWVFQQKDGQRLSVPTDAAGADKIIDALAPLNGIDLSLAAEALNHSQEKSFVLWRATTVRDLNSLSGPLT